MFSATYPPCLQNGTYLPTTVDSETSNTYSGPVRGTHQPPVVSLRSNDMHQTVQWKQGLGQVTQHLQNRLEQRRLNRDKTVLHNEKKFSFSFQPVQ